MGARLARLAVGGLGLLAGACGAETANDDVDVVVLVEVDTLRADALGCYGSEARGADGSAPTPEIDRFAAESVLFERAYSAAPWTVPSLATQLTGRWPWDHGALRLLERLDDDLVTLAERFRAAGWRTGGVMTNFVARRRHGFAQGFDLWDEEHALGHRGSHAHEAVAALFEQADRLARRPGEGLFLFLLLFEPHYLYEEQPGLVFGPERGTRLTGAEEMSDLRRMRAELDERDVSFLRGRYQGEVARVDAAFGELLRGLEERGMMERAVVAFTSDHGEEIMEHGWIGHARSLSDELVRVPLLVRLPDAAGRRVERPVSQIDLGATLLDLAGIEGGLGEGSSLAPALAGEAEPERRYLYLHTDFEPPLQDESAKEKRALQWGVVDADERLKWVVDHLPEDGPVARLYDADGGRELDRDPPADLLRIVALDPSRGESSAEPLADDGGEERP